MKAERVAISTGGVALALLLGALFFQYVLNYPPCEMCHWQRWPHIAAAAIGLGGGLMLQVGTGKNPVAFALAAITILLVATSGVLGVYHSGVEWHWWHGPAACTTGFVFNGTLDLSAPVPMCDRAAWRLFGISMAGYNAIISLGTAVIGSFLLVRKP
jgi:disulfide bond formation protein DsbB